jgi:hypothetical protein
MRFLRFLILALVLAASTAAQDPFPIEADQGNPTVTVWVNIPTHVYHCSGDRWYGKTKHGRFMSQGEALKEGDRKTCIVW